MTSAKKKAKESEVDQHGYSIFPRDITRTAWFYENRDGLQIYQENKDGRDGIISVTIPWRDVEAAVNRHLAVKKPRTR